MTEETHDEATLRQRTARMGATHASTVVATIITRLAGTTTSRSRSTIGSPGRFMSDTMRTSLYARGTAWLGSSTSKEKG